MQRIAKQLRGEAFDWYVAIARGGLVPACLLAEITGCTKIDTLCMSSYGADNKQGKIIHHGKVPTHLKGQRVLIIDDLVDTGKTMQLAVQWVQTVTSYVRTAAVYKKEKSLFTPHHYIEERPSSEWIVFPWEKYQCIKL
jgi:hypoxanthine phosphoribosyltransferase